MKILMLNYNNPMRSSGIVTLDLFNSFRARGHEVKLLVNTYAPDYPENIINLETQFLRKKKDLIKKIKKKLKLNNALPPDQRYHFHEVRENKSFYSVRKLLKKAGIKPDLIFVLFAKNFVNTIDINKLSEKTKAPVLWLMYDMAPITGGCHYAWDCTGYQKNCGNCPGLHSKDPFDITYKNLLIKKENIDKTDIQLIAASEWQYVQAKSSTLFKNKPIHKILLSVDPLIFKPADKTEIRKKLDIRSDAKVAFFGSVYMRDPRKGMTYLLESLNILSERIKGTILENKILLLIAGRQIDEFREFLPFEHKFLGYLDNTYGIASAYQASDVFLCPSIEDSGPQMINQSVMCGLPVVAFEMGVAPDLVKNGETGYMARLGDSADFANGLFEVLSQDDENYNRLSVNCRDLAMELCSPDKQIEMIEEILKKSNTAR